ncbi:hypothetical protein MHY1_p00104 (plasmid) [Methylovirgula sp. HY1]|nr:hypothetical protein MHY1_p00104 [Methylovirgula sp. HY1]
MMSFAFASRSARIPPQTGHLRCGEVVVDKDACRYASKPQTVPQDSRLPASQQETIEANIKLNHK